MAVRNLLHKDKIPEFKLWLTEQGFEWREGGGDYQLMQIKRKDSNGWDVIYERIKMPEHVSVPGPLVKLVCQFVHRNKHVIKSGDPIRETPEKEIAPGPRHSGGEPGLPWDA